jgi:hypothetical protein
MLTHVAKRVPMHVPFHNQVLHEELACMMESHLHAYVANVRSGTSLILTFSLLGFGRVSCVYLLGITKETTYLHNTP